MINAVTVATTLLEAAGYPDARHVAQALSAESVPAPSHAGLLDQLLPGQDPTIGDSLVTRHSSVYETLVQGLLTLAARGHEFVDRSEIERVFGRTVPQNYPEASQTFLRFATTYWTYRIVADQLRSSLPHEPSSALSWLLSRLEADIGALFFPMPGPIKVPPDQREAAQRQLLVGCQVPIDLDDFIRGNPILIRDRRARRGCLHSAAILATLVLVLVLAAV